VFKLDLVLLHFVNIILLYLFHEPKCVDVALDDPDGVISIQEDLNNFTRNQVWELVDETTRISANGIPNLSTSVVVPGGLPRAIPVSVMPKSIQKDKNSKVEYNIYFITLIRVHLFGTCRVQVHRD
jgi:hypothetical protein